MLESFGLTQGFPEAAERNSVLVLALENGEVFEKVVSEGFKKGKTQHKYKIIL